MSYTHIEQLYDLGTAAEYYELGSGSKKKAHLKTGTNRLGPGFYVDAASIEEFVALGNNLAEATGRRVKGHRLLVSWEPDELDVNDPEDLQLAGDTAFELAKRAFPNSPCLVVVHADSEGRNVHAHVTILNHDLVTGKAPTKNRTHAQIKKLNDQLMREQGMRVIDAYEAQKQSWSVRRLERVARIEADQKRRYEEFELHLGDRVEEARQAVLAGDLVDPHGDYVRELEDRGIKSRLTKHVVTHDTRWGSKKGDVEVGLELAMEDEWTPRKYKGDRRRKASGLSRDFTFKALDLQVEIERQRRAAEAQRQQQAAVAKQQRDAMRAAMDSVLPTQEPLDVPADASFDERLAALQARQAEQQRQRDELRGGTSSVAAAPAGHPSVAPAPAVEGEAVVDPSVVATAPTDPSSLAAARAERSAVTESSRLWGYPARDARQRLVTDRLAAFDDYAHAQLAAGLLIDGKRTADEKIGQEKLDLYGKYFFDDVREELEHREKKKARATKLIESGIDDMIGVGKELRAEIREGNNRLRAAKPGRAVRMPPSISQPQQDRDRGLGD